MHLHTSTYVTKNTPHMRVRRHMCRRRSSVAGLGLQAPCDIRPEICATCKIAFFAISAGGSSTRPGPGFGGPWGLPSPPSPCRGPLAPRGCVGARQVPIRQLRPTHTSAGATTRTRTCACTCHGHSHSHTRQAGAPLSLLRTPAGSRPAAAPTCGGRGGNRRDCPRAFYCGLEHRASHGRWAKPHQVHGTACLLPCLIPGIWTRNGFCIHTRSAYACTHPHASCYRCLTLPCTACSMP